MVLKSPFNLTSVMACRGDPPPPKLQAPCIMCGLRVFSDRLLPGCHTISPERIPYETCRGTKTDAVFHSTTRTSPLLATLTGNSFAYGTCFPATDAVPLS